MVRNKKSQIAFTVAEAVITIFIMAVVVSILTFISKKLVPILEIYNNKVSGSFACYWECDKNNQNCILKQAVHDNKFMKEDKDVTEQGFCTFEPVKGKRHMYVIVSGAGSKTNFGQVKTDYTNQALRNIVPGRANGAFEDGTTNISDVEVLAGQIAQNGLQFENIESCELVSYPNKCADELSSKKEVKCAKNSSSPNSPVSCEVMKTDEGVPVVKINGCECEDELNTYNLIKLSDLRRVKGFLDRLDITTLADASKSQLMNIYEYSYSDLPPLNNMFKFNFKMKDSNYDTRTSDSVRPLSHMEDILYNLTPSRRNELIQKIINLHPGAPNKNGAVVILW